MDDVERVRAGNESPEARIAATADAQLGAFSRRQALDARFRWSMSAGTRPIASARRAIMPG